MDTFDTPMNRQKCHGIYSHLESDSASNKTIYCTIAVIIGMILLEVFANARLVCCDTSQGAKDEEDVSKDSIAIPLTTTMIEQPRPRLELQAEPQATPNNDDQTTTNTELAEAKKPDETASAFCCSEDPTPQVRANRLAVSTFLFSLVLMAFIVRIEEATTSPYIDPTCWHIIRATPPNWTAIVFLNIIPFVLASFAFLRALVDCVLVRWNKGLTNDTKSERDDRYFWFPLMPFLLVCGICYVLMELVKIPIAFLMGDREVSLWTSKTKKKVEDTELQGEEAQALVDNVDGRDEVDEQSVGEPPAYDEVCRPRESIEEKHVPDSLA
ncbi:Nn.00g081550.m01.CDS01 [Neocucurbitaria sp. VM-36]